MTGEVIMQWQPIETAPKDGTRVFLWLTDEGFPVLGAWINFDDPQAPAPDWFIFELHKYVFCKAVTHWMPRPLPPND